MPIEVHRESVSKRHYAPILSSTCLYMAFFFFILIFLPLIIAYNSYNFWWKQSFILEQPEVDYKYVSIFQWHGYNSDTAEPLSYYYSTSPLINSLFTGSLRAPILRSAEVDVNRDGRVDRLEMAVQLPLAKNEKITSVTSLVFFDVKLNSIAKYTFDAVSFINYEASSAMGKLEIDGDLLLRQTWPLSAYGGYKNLYTNNKLLPDLVWGLSADEVYIDTIMKQNNGRNVSMVFHSTYQYVSQRAYPLTSQTDNNYMNTSLTIRIPEQPVTYTPPLSAVLKFAWIQYMSFFIVVAFLLYQLNDFIFSHKLLPTYAAADIVYDDHRKMR